MYGNIQTFGGISQVGAAPFYFYDGNVDISVTATGVQTATVTFSSDFPTGINVVLFGVRNVGAGASVGAPYSSAESKSGFTINLDVTTAGTGTATVSYLVLGY